MHEGLKNGSGIRNFTLGVGYRARVDGTIQLSLKGEGNDARPPPRHIGRDTSVEAGIYPHYLYSWSNELLRRQPRVGQFLLEPRNLRERLVQLLLQLRRRFDFRERLGDR